MWSCVFALLLHWPTPTQAQGLREEKISLGIPDEHQDYLKENGFHPETQFELHPGDFRVRIWVRFLPQSDATWWQRWSAPMAEYSLSLSNFDLPTPARSSSEVESSQKWLAENLKFEIKRGRLEARWQAREPASLKIQGREHSERATRKNSEL